jgi:SOS-response transcriptional repressor LexA
MESNEKITHGGYRAGAGRKPKPSNTKSRRIPAEITKDDIKLLSTYKKHELPFYEMKSEDGVPSIANKEQHEKRKPNEKLLINDIQDHFLIQMSGCNLKGEGILENDLLLVSNNKNLNNNNIVIAIADSGKAVIKKMIMDGDKIKLTCESNNCPDFEIDDSSLDRIWGVVTRVIRNYEPAIG